MYGCIFLLNFINEVPILGVAKPVIIGHGISCATAFKNMLVTAQRMLQSGLMEKMKESFVK